MNAIDRDPTAKALLYVPALLKKPLWARLAIGGGYVTAPEGEGASVRRSDWLLGMFVIAMLASGGVGVLYLFIR